MLLGLHDHANLFIHKSQLTQLFTSDKFNLKSSIGETIGMFLSRETRRKGEEAAGKFFDSSILRLDFRNWEFALKRGFIGALAQVYRRYS